MTALVVTNVAAEGPGLLETWFAAEGLGTTVVAPWAGDPLPPLADHSALVVMGGPQQAYDDSLPWRSEILDLLREGVASGVPVLGVCLGAQLLAVACGGTVEPGAAGAELGAGLLAKRDVAGADPLMWDLPLSPVVVQWHWDAVTELPPGSTLLMAGARYEHQAFRVGERAWGLQFHVECDAAMVTAWAEEAGHPEVLERTLPELPEVAEMWGEVMRRFARLAVGA